MKAAPSIWQNTPNGAQISALFNDYAAGEVTASAFVLGALSLMGPAEIAAVLAAGATVGVTVASLVKVVTCVVGSNSALG
jgi:hypothetical protein